MCLYCVIGNLGQVSIMFLSKYVYIFIPPFNFRSFDVLLYYTLIHPQEEESSLIINFVFFWKDYDLVFSDLNNKNLVNNYPDIFVSQYILKYLTSMIFVTNIGRGTSIEHYFITSENISMYLASLQKLFLLMS